MSKLVALLGLITFIAACDNKKDKSSSDPVVPVDNIAPVLPPGTPGTPGGETPPPVVPTPPGPTPSPGPGPGAVLSGLSLTIEGQPVVGEPLKIRAIATWQNPDATQDVDAELILVQNEAGAAIDATDTVLAARHGLVKIEGTFEGKKATADVQFQYPAQFWLYRDENNQPLFNTPWDKDEGDEIKRSAEGMPDYAIECLKQSQKALADAEANGTLKWNTLAAQGATDKLVYLVNIVSNKNRIQKLRELDRDAYFWHWTSPSVRPYLALSDFKSGSFVWEVVASPQDCVQPSVPEAQRYVDYVAKRLAKK